MDWDAFLNAIREKDRRAYDSLLEAQDEFDFESKNEIRYASWFSGIGFTLLQLTAFLRSGWARQLLARGATLDLHTACALGDVESVKRLLSEKGHAYQVSIDSYVPSQFALEHPSALRALLEHGEDPDRLIRKLAWFDWEDTAADRGASEWRLIHMVGVGRGKGIETAEVLKEFGADLEATALPFGEAAIHLAAIYDRAPLIRWLVDQGVPVDFATAESPFTETPTDLFEAEPFAPFDGHGKTPLMLALGEGQSAAVEVLLELGADVKASDSRGHTPVHYAAGAFWQENVALVERLVQCGAKLEQASGSGETPLDLARRKGYQETVNLLGRV